jgi:hypothetical protein
MGASSVNRGVIVIQIEALTVISEDVHRGELQRVERPTPGRERLQRA